MDKIFILLMFKQTSPQSLIKISRTGHLRFHFQWQLFIVMSRMVLVSANPTSAACMRHKFIFNLSIDDMETSNCMISEIYCHVILCQG